MAIHAQIQNFIVYIKSEKGLAYNTIEAYQRDLMAFAAFLKQEGVMCSTQLNQSQIIDYLSYLKSHNYASSTLCRALIAIKVFCRFLKREGITEKNSAFYLETPKLWQLIPDVLSIQEVDLLLQQPKANTVLEVRDKAILELFYSSGLRVSEICTLKIYDVDDTFIKVLGKGSKERLVPIGKQALKAIDNYLAYRDQWDSENETTLFVSKSGHPLDRIAIWRQVKKYAKQAGITKNISPHTLRHSFATHLLDHGADLRVIQEMLGHENISSTDRYTHISSSHLQKAFQASHLRF